MRDIVKRLPRYDYVYVGDTARAPYGARAQKDIYRFTKQAVDFLFGRGCELVIVACNSASAEALHDIQHRYLPARHPKKKVLGVLIPFSEEAIHRTRTKRIGVIATMSTVRSHAFIRELKKIEPRAYIFQKAAPALVPLVEAGKESTPLADRAIRAYLKPVLAKRIDTLVLGCTHYGLLKKAFKNAVGSSIDVVSQERVVPPRLASYLKRHPEIEQQLARRGTREFFTTGETTSFSKIGSRFYGKRIVARKAQLK